jgi:hypothetical protein
MVIANSDALIVPMKLEVDIAYITTWDVCYEQVS